MTSTLIEAITKLYRATEGQAGALLRDAIPQLERCGLDPPRNLAAQQLPVCRALPACVEAARHGPLAGIATAIWSIASEVRWTQNPNYTPARAGPAFLANYGYVELIGHNGLWQSDRIAIGFLLLGPETHYQEHHHPAAEVYHVVSGNASWWREDRDWTREPPGCAIVHGPHVRHATRTAAEALLALYFWVGDVAIAAQLAAFDDGR